MKRAINVKTKEEWDTALSKIRDNENLYNYIPDEYLCESDGTHCNKEWFLEQGYTIVTFEEWLNPQFIPQIFN